MSVADGDLDWVGFLAFEGFGEDGGDRDAVNAAACFRVTIFERGVVISLVKLPATNPTPSSSSTGSDFPFPLARSLRSRKKLYTRKKKNESVIVFPVSGTRPV